MEEETEFQPELHKSEPKTSSFQKKLKLHLNEQELSSTPIIQYEIMLNDVNLIKPNINVYKLEHTSFVEHPNNIVINDKLFKINLPVIWFILSHPNLEPKLTGENSNMNLVQQLNELLRNYASETNYSGQTPLMISACLNNTFYVQQLIKFDVGKLDDYDKSALDYAYEFNANPTIIDILEQYEYGC